MRRAWTRTSIVSTENYDRDGFEFEAGGRSYDDRHRRGALAPQSAYSAATPSKQLSPVVHPPSYISAGASTPSSSSERAIV